MKAAQTAKNSGLTVYQALSTDTGKKVLAATFDWLRKHGVEETLIKRTIELLARTGDDPHENPLVLEIMDRLEIVIRYGRSREENRPRLVCSNLSLDRPHLKRKAKG